MSLKMNRNRRRRARREMAIRRRDEDIIRGLFAGFMPSGEPLPPCAPFRMAGKVPRADRLWDDAAYGLLGDDPFGLAAPQVVDLDALDRARIRLKASIPPCPSIAPALRPATVAALQRGMDRLAGAANTKEIS